MSAFDYHKEREAFIQTHGASNGDKMFKEFLRRVKHEERSQRLHWQKTPDMIFDEMQKEYFGL